MLKEKVVLVAGAGGLLGTEIVKASLSAGSSVIAADLNLDAMTKRLASQGVAVDSQALECVSFDITDEQCVIDQFENVEGLTGAVNCTYPRNLFYGAKFFDVSVSSFCENVNLHLGSTFLFTQQCAAYFKKHQSPFSLVNISSIYGVVAPKFSVYENTAMTMPVEYAAIKSAIIHLNKYVAKFIADSRFRVNSISPGGIQDKQPEAFLASYQEHCLTKGMLDPCDLTGAITFLLSDFSNYINGQNLVIDDGFSL